MIKSSQCGVSILRHLGEQAADPIKRVEGHSAKPISIASIAESSIVFGQNYQGFVDVSNFDGAEGSEERSNLSNFIIGNDFNSA
jgi:hypothetical protein